MPPRARVRLDLSQPQIRRLLYGPTGPVVVFVRGITRKVRTRCVLTCPVDKGNLRAAHREEVGTRLGAVFGFVINDVEYAQFVHDGTQPHRITPRRPGGLLRFRAQGGALVFTTLVRHPGTNAQPWMSEALEQVAVPAGFRLIRT